MKNNNKKQIEQSAQQDINDFNKPTNDISNSQNTVSNISNTYKGVVRLIHGGG